MLYEIQKFNNYFNKLNVFFTIRIADYFEYQNLYNFDSLLITK